jgi:outer membrane immunogenic protein
MRRLLLAAVLFGAVQGAQAADMPDLPILRGAMTDGLNTARVNWQGVYVGLQGAYGTSSMNLAGTDNPAIYNLQPITGLTPDSYYGLGKTSGTGSAYGGFAGYNWQFEDVVVGIDGSYLHGSFKGADSAAQRLVGPASRYRSLATAAVDLHDFASVRARAGYMIGSFLPYGTLGVGLGNASVVSTATVFDSLSPALAFGSLRQDRFVYGYSAGFGVDMMLVGCLFLRAEYEYQRMMTPADHVNAPIDIGLNTFRAGVGYKF